MSCPRVDDGWIFRGISCSRVTRSCFQPNARETLPLDDHLKEGVAWVKKKGEDRSAAMVPPLSSARWLGVSKKPYQLANDHERGQQSHKQKRVPVFS